MNEVAVWLRALPALLSVMLLGSGLTLLLWRGSARISVWEWLGWSWLTGVGAGSALLGIVGLLLRGPWLFGAMAMLSLATAIIGWRRRAGTPQWWPVEGSPREKWLVTIPILLSGTALALALRETVLSDGLFLIEFKARVAFLNGGEVPGLLFTDPERVMFHPSYPLLTPLAELWIYLGARSADQALTKTLFAPFYVASVFLTFGFVARCTKCLAAGAIATALTLGVPQLLSNSFTLQFGYADYTLAALFLAGTAALLLPEPKLALAALAAALMVWTKAEGVLLWALLTVATAILPSPSRWRAAFYVAMPGASVFLLWHAVLRMVHAQAEQSFYPLDASSLAQAAHRLWPVLTYFAHELANTTSWGLLWWSLPLAVLAGWRTPQRPRILFTAALATGALCLDVVPYLFTRLDLAYHLQTSCDRLVLQSAWVALLPLALALGALIDKSSAPP